MTGTRDANTRDDRPARFVQALGQLDRGQLASLRASLGGREAHWLEGLFERSRLGGERPDRKDALRLLAGLYALKPKTRQDEGDAELEEPGEPATAGGVSLGQLLGRLYLRQERRPSTEKRFLALLDADRDGLGHHLRQAVMLLASEELTPDWVQLAHDLLWWGDPQWGDRVRRRWAQDFYREISRDPKAADGPPPGDGPEETGTAPLSSTHPFETEGDDAAGDTL